MDPASLSFCDNSSLYVAASVLMDGAIIRWEIKLGARHPRRRRRRY